MKRQREDAEVPSSSVISRRSLMKGTAAVAAGAAVSALAPSGLVPAAEAQNPSHPYVARPTVITASPHKNVVETDCGKVYGSVKMGS